MASDRDFGVSVQDSDKTAAALGRWLLVGPAELLI